MQPFIKVLLLIYRAPQDYYASNSDADDMKYYVSIRDIHKNP